MGSVVDRNGEVDEVELRWNMRGTNIKISKVYIGWASTPRLIAPLRKPAFRSVFK